MVPGRRLSTASAIRAYRRPPNGNVPVGTEATSEANASRSRRRARWSLVFTVSGRRPRAWAVSSMLISSTAHHEYDAERFRQLVDDPFEEAADLVPRGGALGIGVPGCDRERDHPCALAPGEGVEVIEIDGRTPLRTRPSASLRTIRVSHVERFASLRNSPMAAKART